MAATEHSTQNRAAALRAAAFCAFLVVLAGAVWLVGRPADAVVEGAPFEVMWVWLAVAFAVMELSAVHIEARREAHAITFVEIAYVFALMFSTPEDLLIGRVLGGFVVLGLVRRQTRLKLAVNLALFALEAAATVVVYRALLGDASAAEPRGWLAMFGALVFMHLLGAVVVTVAIRLLRFQAAWSTLWQALGFGSLTCLANTATGLAVAVSVWNRSFSGLLFAGAVAALFILYNAHTRLTLRHRDLQDLHGFIRSVGSAAEQPEREKVVLEEARAILRAEVGALLVPGAPDSAAARVVSSDSGLERRAISSEDLAEDLALLLPDGKPRLHRSGEPLPGWLADGAVRDAIAVPVSVEDSRSGALVVANRLTEVSSFVKEDMRVLQTLANHASMVLENGRLVAHLQHEAAERAYQALHDPVTELPNRQALAEALDAAVQAARIRSGAVGLIFIDIDTFKEVTDTLGAAIGDKLLVQVKDRLIALLGPGTKLARYGGEVFAVMITDVVDQAEVVGLAERLNAGFDTPFTSGEVTLMLGASFGVALYPEHAANADVLVHRADAATYAARLAGSGIEVYSVEAAPYAPRRMALAAELREAMDRGAVEVYVQPKVSLADGMVRGAEGLVRWVHPRSGPVSPAQFIPAAEQTGVIRALTLYVVRDALEQCRSWREAGLDLTVAVNLSARNLFDPHLVEEIGAAVEEFGLPPMALTLELTESTVMGGSRRSMEILEGLHSLGVWLSVDDFGTGYSSLAHLRQLPVSELKVDRSFVSTMTVNEHDAVIVRTIIELGRSLGLRTVAEGVESREAWDMLREFGCDEAQGYLLSRPLPARQFRQWLERQRVRRLYSDPVVPLRPGRRALTD